MSQGRTTKTCGGFGLVGCQSRSLSLGLHERDEEIEEDEVDHLVQGLGVGIEGSVFETERSGFRVRGYQKKEHDPQDRCALFDGLGVNV